MNHVGCHYEEDIRALFVETDGLCQPLRIGATITSKVNSSFHCLTASKITSWLSHWNSTYGNVEMFKAVKDGHDQRLNLTHCSSRIEQAPSVNIQKCHRVFYCSKLPKRDRTVCLVNGRFLKRITQIEQNFQLSVQKNPRILCVATFV